MLYLIHIEVPVEPGNKIEEAGGPGKLFGYLQERFKPEAFYCTTTARTIWLVAKLDSLADIAELMLVSSSRVGAYPKFYPVAPAAEMGKVIKEALDGVKKAPTI